MKKIIWIVSLVLATSSWSFAQNQDLYHDNNSDDVYYNDNTGYGELQADNDGMSYQTFYDQLAPYGNWINYPGYGYVWVPQTEPGFSPYTTNGNWVYTDMGWTWVSDYAWGWATFHYGRWYMDPDYGGWLWIPGYDWAPAWVTWGMYEGYYCWAPLGPGEYLYEHRGYGRYDHHWNCLPRERMGEQGMGRYIVNSGAINHDNNDFERRINRINNTNTYSRSVFNSGPRAEEVQKVTGHQINRVAINNSAAPGKTEIRGNQINVYRPAISRNNATQQHAIPAKIVNPSEIQHNNPTPTRNEQPRAVPSNIERQNNNSWTPPRQNVPRAEPRQQQRQYQPQPQRQSEPSYQRPSGGFIPSERPAQQQRSAPMPSYHAPAPSGGNRGGGGRHR